MAIRRDTTVVSYLALCLFLILLCAIRPARSQSTSATLDGQVTEVQGKIVPDVVVQVVNVDTNITYPGTTNNDGIYVIVDLPPGNYRIVVRKDGFHEINKTDIVLHVQDRVEQNFTLQVGSVNESVTVRADQVNVNTADGSVSTVVDQNFIQSIPLNGRSLQPLIALTPGVVLTPATSSEQGQFSVNGQRADANYFMVDGVSATFGMSSPFYPGQATGGALPALNATGGTNNLVSLDAIQEFRIETKRGFPV
jgi:hypothetical protein